MNLDTEIIAMLRCPVTGEPVRQEGDYIVSQTGAHRYRISASRIPLFAEEFCSPDGRAQQKLYDRASAVCRENLEYPHTREYMAYLDRVFNNHLGEGSLGDVAELCCGTGEGLRLLANRVTRGVGVDVSEPMLETAGKDLPAGRFTFLQGDATRLPLASDRFDSVVILGGIHHVRDRRRLFSEVSRILKPGGRFYWREPVSDFLPWRALRFIIYRLSPLLDPETEQPLLYSETVPRLEESGFRLKRWRTYGFLGFCFFMNSDVLIVNRYLRYVPGIRGITRLMAGIDDLTLRIPGMSRAGLQVVGVAEKPVRP